MHAKQITNSSPRFNPLSKRFKHNPYPIYDELRCNPPFKTMNMWVISRYDDVASILKDRRFSSSLIPKLVESQITGYGLSCDEVLRLGKKSIVFTDPPDHSRLRQLIKIAFDGESLNKLQTIIQDTAEDLLSSMLSSTSLDWVASVSEPMSLRVIRCWMGLGESTEPSLKKWTHLIRAFLEPGFISANQYVELHVNLLEYMDFFRSQIARVKVSPDGSLINTLINSSHQNDYLTDDELIFVCIMFYVAGVETTSSLLSNICLQFTLHPKIHNALRDNPGMISNFVDEATRFESPLQLTKRIAIQDTNVAGVDINSGDQILLCLGSANRDENIFKSPGDFDIYRSNASRHLGFGAGMHACLGGVLANMQAKVLVKFILESDRYPCLIDENLVWSSHSQILRGLKHLFVRFK